MPIHRRPVPCAIWKGLDATTGRCGTSGRWRGGDIIFTPGRDPTGMRPRGLALRRHVDPASGSDESGGEPSGIEKCSRKSPPADGNPKKPRNPDTSRASPRAFVKMAAPTVLKFEVRVCFPRTRRVRASRASYDLIPPPTPLLFPVHSFAPPRHHAICRTPASPACHATSHAASSDPAFPPLPRRRFPTAR
jgi:hypothetical protein